MTDRIDAVRNRLAARRLEIRREARVAGRAGRAARNPYPAGTDFARAYDAGFRAGVADRRAATARDDAAAVAPASDRRGF